MEKIRVVCPYCGGVNSIPKKESYAKASCGHCKKSLLESHVKEVNKDEFDNFVVNSDIPVVVDFWAAWCGPCKMMAPSFKEASSHFALKASFIKVNTEEHQELSAKFDIRSIPTMIIFKNNREIDRVSGALSNDQIKNWVRKYV